MITIGDIILAVTSMVTENLANTASIAYNWIQEVGAVRWTKTLGTMQRQQHDLYCK
jgi:hypothetical protein